MLHRLMRGRFPNSRNETIWLTVYADMITNLALVFLALYGLTIMGEDALSQAIQSMKINEVVEVVDKTEIIDFSNVGTVLHQEFNETPDISISEEIGATR